MIDKKFIIWKNDHFDIINFTELKDFLKSLYHSQVEEKTDLNNILSKIIRL